MKKGEINPNRGCSSKCFLAIFSIAIIIFIFQAVFIFGGFFKDHMDIIGNIFIVSLSLLTVISTILIYHKLPSNFPVEKRGKLLLSISFILFFIGDLLWLIAEIFLGDLVPLGGYPDLVWGLAYIFLIFSLIYFISISFRPSKSTTYVVILMAIIIGGGILYQDVNEDLEEGSFNFNHSLQDSYILYDIVSLFLVLYLIWPIIFSGTRFGLHWIILGAGILTRLFYDQIFANMSQNGTYYTGHPVDLLYVLFYLFALFAFYIKSKDFEVENDKISIK